MTQQLIQTANTIRENGKVDVVKLARKLNLSVRPINTISELGTSAYIQKEDGTFAIYVNGNQSKQRQRFSIAHEIAHYFLHKDQLEAKGILHRSAVQQLSSTDEQQADILAAKILMPEEDITQQLSNLGITPDVRIKQSVIEKLCKRYDVSFYAMIVKLRELGYNVPFISVYA